MSDESWNAIFDKCRLGRHDFDRAPYTITAAQIKDACQHFRKTSQKEVRILCKQDTREKRPAVFRDKGLFLLPVKNGTYQIIKGEGYVDIPEIKSPLLDYAGKLDFPLVSSLQGDSEMQHLDYAYAASLVRTFAGDDSLVLTIRGRKYTPPFDFTVGGRFSVSADKVQTEVDSGYEGRGKIVLVEAKNAATRNTIIRQLYYPYRQWKIFTGKDVEVMFFERRKTKGGGEYHLWQFAFGDEKEYNSITLKRSARYAISPP